MKNELNMYAYVAPTNGEYVNEKGEKVNNGDFRTEEKYREYKECGFDTLLLLGNDPYNGENFEDSDLKKNLDLCEKVGLKCIVYDKALHDLSAADEELVGDGKKFRNACELRDFVGNRLKAYSFHPAFYGVEIMDEPSIYNFRTLSEVYKAIKAIDKKIYINAVLLPFFEGLEKRYTEKLLTDREAYADYVEEWFKSTSASVFDFDVYPFVFGENETENDEGRIFPLYLSNMQLVSEIAKKHNTKFFVTMQSYASRSDAAGCAYKRKMSFADFRYQKNVALSFGAKDFRYYTYWLFPSQLGDPSSEAIMTEKGEKVYYDFVKKVNEELKEEFKIVGDYEYVKTELVGELPHFKGVITEKIDGITINSDVPLIINEMKSNNKRAVYIINADNPAKKIKANVTLDCGRENLQVLSNGVKSKLRSDDGRYDFIINEGEGVFIEL